MHWRSFGRTWPVAVGCALAVAAGSAVVEAAELPIRDDVAVQRALEDARERFLERQEFDRLDVTVLLLADDATWLRGSVGGRQPWYPASCVKLAFAVAATHWCESHGREPACLDASVAPMLRVSDNVATGVVVDAISGVVNGPAESADFEAWLARRSYTEDLLQRHGLLDGQRFVNKTYPTNSGEMPEGLEHLALERHGRNSMHADGAARLMLALVLGEFGAPAAEIGRAHV